MAYHAIFCAYGFWLPNDPRGSWSDFVRSWELYKFGPATKVDTRASVAHMPHDRERRLAAKQALRYPPVIFSGVQARAIGHGFAHAVERSGYVIHACSILPEHVHVVVGRHSYRVERIVAQLKGEATKQLLTEGIHPMRARPNADRELPSPWSISCWKVFLSTPEAVQRAIEYAEGNPQRKENHGKNGVL